MPAQSEVLWRQLPGVRAGERTRFLFFAALATLLNLAETLGLAGTEALFLARYGASALPLAFIGAAVVTVLGSMVYAAWVGTTRNDALFVVMLAGSACVIGLCALLVGMGAAAALPVLLCLFYLCDAVFLNHLWTFTGDFFDTVQSKRLIPLFTIGSSVGGFLGGVLGTGMAVLLGPLSLIVGWAMLLGVAAVMLYSARLKLRRWGPLEHEEADETSVEGMRAAMRYLGTSSLGRWLSISAMTMMLSLFVLQYIYSGIFVETFETPARLAAFFGLYLAITNVIEILIEVRITPWLIRRLGVPSANLLHPMFTLISFGGLAMNFSLTAALFGRVNRELFENSFAGPLRALVYNAMPQRFRGRTRAFLEGIVVYAGMALAGLFLLVFDAPGPVWLCAVGGGTAVMYLAANIKVRREYMKTLIHELRAGRLDLDDLGDEVGQWEGNQLAELWEQLLANETETPSRSLLQLIPGLAARRHVEPLVRAASHPHPVVRRSCLNALATLGDDSGDTALVLGLEDEAASVRLAALRGLMRIRSSSRTLDPIYARLLDDPDPAVRSEAAVNAGDAGETTLRAMIRSTASEHAIAALHSARSTSLEIVLERIGDPDPEVRAAALECVARISPAPPFDLDGLREISNDANPQVRRAGVMLLANIDDADAIYALAGVLADPSRAVRFAAETILASLGEVAIDAALPQLRAQREPTVRSALRTIRNTDVPRAREVLREEFRKRVFDLWRSLASYQFLEPGTGLAGRFLATAFTDDMLRNRRLAFSILELLEDRNVTRRVERSLHSTSTRARGDALEVLSHMGDREAASLLVLLHEAGPVEDRIPTASEIISLPGDASAAIAVAEDSGNAWLALAARAVIDAELATAEEMNLMERLLALKQVPLFSQLSLEQLEAVLKTSTEVEYLANETIVREGDRGGDLFLLIDGEVEFYKDYRTRNETRLGRVIAVSYFGEMAAIDDQPRSATVVATARSRLLRLNGESLKDLIRQMPEISLEIMSVLTARVRRAERKLAELKQTIGPQASR